MQVYQPGRLSLPRDIPEEHESGRPLPATHRLEAIRVRSLRLLVHSVGHVEKAPEDRPRKSRRQRNRAQEACHHGHGGDRGGVRPERAASRGDSQRGDI